MKILWITNGTIGAACQHFYNREPQGGWMEAMLEEIMAYEDVELVIVTSGNVQKTNSFVCDGVIYYLLPGGMPIEEYNGYEKRNIEVWRKVLQKEQPDAIHIWGSESTLGIAAQYADPNIPSLVYIQGLLESLARYFESGIDNHTLRKFVTLRDVLKKDSISQRKDKYKRLSAYEQDMIRRAGHVISENRWCDTHCKRIAPQVSIHHCALPINKVFSRYSWGKNYEPYTIMCPLPYAPIKGLHMLLQALAIVKKDFPNVKLYVPGKQRKPPKTMMEHIKYNGYSKYINYLSEKLSLRENIFYMGWLSPTKMAEKMAFINVFCMCSSIENHSSTLKEAMTVGTPSVSSNVGGVPEYLIHRENGLLYRFEEYELLAEYIKQLFIDENLCKQLSQNARESLKKLQDSAQTIDTMINIYKSIINTNS